MRIQFTVPAIPVAQPRQHGSPKKATDAQILVAYEQHGSVWIVAKQLGMCGQSVHERLCRMGRINHRQGEFTIEQQVAIADAYKAGFLKGDGVLDSLAALTRKSKQNVSRWARRNGLTNRGRTHAGELKSRQAEASRDWHSKNEHPRGFLGGKHSPEAKRLISDSSTRSHERRTPEQRAAMTLKSLKGREATGSLYRPHRKTTWKSGWRTIGGVQKFYRSRWEANYARYLELLRSHRQIAAWEHEPETFWFESIKRGTRSYLPDFRVTRNDGSTYYVEVKGWMDDRSKTKLKRMKKYHPRIEIELVGGKQYRAIEKTAAGLIPDWE